MPDHKAHNDLVEAPDRSALGRPVEQLLAAIRTLRLVGRVVFVHSAWSSVKPLRIEPLEFLELLCEAIGPRGTLVMPAYPMTGFSQAYLESNPVFDWEQTPSRTGLLTELLRSMSGSERSLHPTHSVTARGALAGWITDGHERSETPFDQYSPFQKMYDYDAIVLNLGVHLMTFRHLADHRLEAELPHPVYAEHISRVKMIDRERHVSWIETRAHNPDYKVDYRPVVRRLRRSGNLVSLNLAGVPVDVIPVRPFVDSYCRAFRDGNVSFMRREAGDVDAGPVAWS